MHSHQFFPATVERSLDAEDETITIGRWPLEEFLREALRISSSPSWPRAYLRSSHILRGGNYLDIHKRTLQSLKDTT